MKKLKKSEIVQNEKEKHQKEQIKEKFNRINKFFFVRPLSYDFTLRNRYNSFLITLFPQCQSRASLMCKYRFILLRIINLKNSKKIL